MLIDQILKSNRYISEEDAEAAEVKVIAAMLAANTQITSFEFEGALWELRVVRDFNTENAYVRVINPNTRGDISVAGWRRCMLALTAE